MENAALDPAFAQAIDNEAAGPLTRAALAAGFIQAKTLSGEGIDPTGATGSRAAIQAKVDAAIADNLVLWADGTFLCDGSINVDGPLRIMGPGVFLPALPATKTVTNKALTSNVATLTGTSTPHGYAVDDSVVVSIGDATFDGTGKRITAVTSTTFSYGKTAANVASAAASGTVADI